MSGLDKNRQRNCTVCFRATPQEVQMLETEIETAAEKAGIKPKTLRNARYELGVVSSKVGRQWVWALPEE